MHQRQFRAAASIVAALSFAVASSAVAQSSAAPSASPPSARVHRIVVDAGHGGTEDGAIGPSGLKEKELTLDVAKRLAALLQADGFDVSLTRDSDVTLPLDARAGVANNKKADLFISLHANASRFSKARGAETFFLAREATDDSARTIAALENDAAGTAAQAAASGDSDLSLILWDMAQVEHLADSQKLAAIVQESLNKALGITDRGVRQAPFRVLVGSTCPSVLVELGFITNPEDEALLSKPDYRDKLAAALHAAVRRYRDSSTP